MNIRLPMWSMVVVVLIASVAGMMAGWMLFLPREEGLGPRSAEAAPVEQQELRPVLSVMDERFDRLKGLRRADQIEHLRHTQVDHRSVQRLLDEMAHYARRHGSTFECGEADLIPLRGEAMYRLYVVVTVSVDGQMLRRFSVWDIDGFLMKAIAGNDIARALAAGDFPALQAAALAEGN